MLKGYLDQNNISYQIKYADEDSSLAQELYDISGQLGVPYTIVELDNGTETGILGFDKPKFDDLLKLS